MSRDNVETITRIGATSNSVLATNSVIRNTYALLSMTLVFSAITAFLGTIYHIALPLPITLIGMFGLLFLTHALANSVMGLVSVFAFTGFMGLTLGPILNGVLHLSNGSQIICAAFLLTAAIFFTLSGYALVTRKNFNYLAGFLMAGFTVVIVASLISLFFQVPAVSLVISCAVVLLSAGYILFETSQIVNGGQRNYILATISLYVSIYNIFTSLLHILSAFSGRSD